MTGASPKPWRAAGLLLQRQQALQALQAEGLSAFVRERAAEARQAVPSVLKQLVVRPVGALERVAVQDLIRLCAAGDCVELYLRDGRRLLHRAALSALETRPPAGEFLRVHRSVLVRPGQIAGLSVEGDGVYRARLLEGSSLPVSERYIDQVRALF